MSIGRVPPPDFDENRYERPNQNWICGHACTGCPCRIGPSPAGECRATTECTPVLTTKEGETKGTWKCTRPKEWGGACPTGPNPDGTCCKTIPKCQPVRSLRARRGLVTRVVIALAVAVLLIALGGNLREGFINPAPLSRAHSGPEFVHLAAKQGGGQGCVMCHEEAKAGWGGLARSAVEAATVSLSFSRLAGTQPKDFSRMDASCLSCHEPQGFHHPAVVHATACSTCHVEHQGAGPMLRVVDRECAACHGDRGAMAAAAKKARTLPAALLADRPAPGVIAFVAKRTPEDPVHVVTGFSKDHPEFRAVRPGQTDANPLKFNHKLHLSSELIPPVGGRALNCADCHRPDAAGAFMQRITFEANCRSCHSLNFDERNPGMTLPHGDAAFARAYLRNLPMEYADHATRTLGIANRRDVAAFVEQQINSLRERNRTGEDLERAAFFNDGKTGPAAGIAGRTGEARARFAGCAYCHTVTPRGDAVPEIAVPQTPDRWFLHATFHHGKHAAMACAECHDAAGSQQTADIILPKQQSCVQCHGPKAGVAESCSTCHHYHNPPPTTGRAARLTPGP